MPASVCLTFERRIPPNVPTVDLTGPWNARPGDGDLAKEFADPAFVEQGWTTVELPHHWRTVEEFAAEDGPFLYRRTFTAPPPATGRRSFLEYDGVFYYGDAWFDGDYLGATEGYFVPHAFEVTDALARTSDHVVALEVACPPQHDRTAKRTITGLFGHWDAADPAFNPGGPWRPMRIAETGRVRIANLRVLCTEAMEERGRLTCSITLDADEGPLDAVLRAHVVDEDGRTLLDAFRAVTLATGENQQSWTLTVEEAPRWWPRSLGAQPLCTLALSVSVADDTSDERMVRTAFRDVRVDDWKFSINGERLFLKGANLAPTSMALADATIEEIRRDLVLAQEANLDFVRVHAHVAASGAVRRGRRARPARVAGPPAAVGLRTRCAAPGRAASARDGRPARPPPERVPVVRAQRTVRRGPRTGRAMVAWRAA